MSLSATALITLNQAKNYLHVDQATSLVVSAEAVGTGNGIEVTFTLDHTPLEGTYKIFVDSILKVETTDYTISGATITFTTAGKPANGKIVTAAYSYPASEDSYESWDDELIEDLIEAATKRAESYTGRAFIRRDITETHIGDGTQALKLYKQPIVEVSSITIDGVELSDWTERLSIGRLYHSTVWVKDTEIVVEYTAGYAATRAATQALIPDAVAAVLLILANLHENRVDHLKHETITGLGTVIYDIPSKAKALLDPYRTNLL